MWLWGDPDPRGCPKGGVLEALREATVGFRARGALWAAPEQRGSRGPITCSIHRQGFGLSGGHRSWGQRAWLGVMKDEGASQSPQGCLLGPAPLPLSLSSGPPVPAPRGLHTPGGRPFPPSCCTDDPRPRARALSPSAGGLLPPGAAPSAWTPGLLPPGAGS